MKKLLAILLTVAMMATMSMTAFATQEITGDSGTVEITYGVSQSYTVVIPADITLSAGEPSTMEVSASNVVIPYGNQLTVSISSANSWYLVDTEDSNNKLSYTVKNGETAVANNDAVLTVAAGDTDGDTVSLTTTLVDSATTAGTYKDTLTFNVTVAAPTISFSIDNVGNCTAEEGMTWAEWLATNPETGGFPFELMADYENIVGFRMYNDEDLFKAISYIDLNGDYYAVKGTDVIAAGTNYGVMTDSVVANYPSAE